MRVRAEKTVGMNDIKRGGSEGFAGGELRQKEHIMESGGGGGGGGGTALDG